jgi:hypothetical protein
MKKIVFISLFFLVFGASYGQKAESGKVKSPDIYFEETSKDFGTIEEGTSTELVFKFFNSGNAPLLLKNVQPSCGCTLTNYTKEPVLPGKSGEIKATFNSSGKAGQNVHKSITVRPMFLKMGLIKSWSSLSKDS